MNVIFLDIDGVLNCEDTPNPRKFPYIVDARLLSLLKELVARTRANVVLSSSWRTDPVGLLAAKYYDVPFIDVCPDLPEVSRCEEMLKWLSEHQAVHIKEIVPKLEPVLAKPFTQIFLGAVSGA